MTRLHVSLMLLFAASCTVDTKPLCPDEFTPNDEACAWQYCRGHAGDPLCSDASMPKPTPIVDAGRDALVLVDATIDAHVVVDASNGCKTAMDCPSATPYCLSSGACVACQQDTDCPAQSPTCSAGACTSCTASTQCSRFADAKACEVSSGGCVACTAQEPAACMAQSQVCKASSNVCVQCNQNTDCTTPTAARCTSDACAACTVDNDCSHIAGKPTCNAGTCVACTPATEAQRCGDNACDPDTLTCTSTRRSSLGACSACKSDSECIESHRCVQVPFMGQSSGFYCMKVATSGCAQPYGTAPLSAASKSGAAAALYCSHNTSQASCESVRALTTSKPCTLASVAADCGAGGRCESVNFIANRCTYACASSATCPVDFPCNADHAKDAFCGGP